jgi:hypothetical protein
MAEYPRPPKRVRDPWLLRRLHHEWKECALCGATGPQLSLHHLRKHPRDDTEENLVMLCGSGTTGCHGLIEANDAETHATLEAYLGRERPEALVYYRKGKRSR